MRTKLAYPLVASLLLVFAVPAQGSAVKTAKKEDDTSFTLANIFPEKSMFGPSASSPAFSHDGRYAAWLYRPHVERRHGSDLWLMEAASGKVKRLTSATVMAEYQKSAREVVEDRVKKAEKETEKEKDGDKEKKPGRKKDSEGELGDRVGDKDADDEKAPRYGGIAGFEWAPGGHEFLFTSGGDVYRYEVKNNAIERLTCTEKSERSVQYLPDGSGYTYLLDGALMKVTFGSHLVAQMDPSLPRGETMTRYRLSPDGKRLVFLSRKGEGPRTGNRRVKIASYRDRFMDVREVPRHVSDDPLPETWEMVYLYELEGALREQSEPVLVHKHKVTGPRDVLQLPEWAPDSSRVTFAVFEQDSEHVAVLQAEFPGPVKEAKEKKKPKGGEKKTVEAVAKKTEEKEVEAKKTDEKKIKEVPAKVVYRFLHQGGPNTPRMMQPRYLADSRHICFLSEQTGFRHVHVLDPLYESQRPLTWGKYEVYPFDISKDHETLYVTATKEDSACEDVYALDLQSGDMMRLTSERGVYGNCAVSPDGRTLLASFSCYGRLRELVKVDVTRHRQVALTDSHPEKAKKLTAAEPEFFSYENRHGHEIRGHMFKPAGWRKSDKRPLLIYVYGGPLGTRKQVVEGSFHSAAYFFGQYMAREHGWLAVTIDPRGMSGYGGVFEKANFEQVGKPQVEDLVDGVQFLVESYGVDPEKVSMHGWSFGGFQTQMCMYTEPEVFKVGIAGAGPTEWENYNSWYSTGTIGESRTGKPDLEKYSLLPLAKNLEGKLLLVHGMEDSNVLYQDTVRVYRELLKAGKETLVELFLDPTGGHGLGGDVKTLNRYRKYEEFLVRNLGTRKRDDKSTGVASGGESSGEESAPRKIN